MVVDRRRFSASGRQVVDRVLKIERGQACGVDHDHDAWAVYRREPFDRAQPIGLVGEDLVCRTVVSIPTRLRSTSAWLRI